MIPEGKAFYEKVRKSGYGCYILSNYPREGFAYTENRYTSFFSNTDGMVISGRVHMAKPDEAIFQYLLDTYALKKEECVFFDDTKGNVDAANAFGIRSFVYTDPDTAWSDLQSLHFFSETPTKIALRLKARLHSDFSCRQLSFFQ